VVVDDVRRVAEGLPASRRRVEYRDTEHRITGAGVAGHF
jgi:hypothetical protein